MDELRRLLQTYSSVEIIERRFDTRDGIESLGDNPFVSQCTSNNYVNFIEA